MISYLSGEIIAKDIESCVTIDVNGVGYGVRTSFNDYQQLETGEPIKLFIYEHIREDSYDLYGFIAHPSKQLFEQLLSVKNVGPKVALAVISLGAEERVREAIANGDVRLLQTAKGVGKRAAEQIVVELRDKVGLASSMEAEGIVTRGAVDTNDEAVQALIELGYSPSDAAAALQGIDSSLLAEDRVKQALKGKS